jgi:hypothetical protein
MSMATNPLLIPEDEYPTLQQFTTPVDEGYAALVGHATYAWTYLEWQIVSVGEKIAPGFLYTVANETAGSTGNILVKEVRSFAGDAALTAELAALADAFLVLRKRRNRLLHAHPVTLHGKQRLHYWSPKKDKQTGTVSVDIFDWEPDEIVTFTKDTEALARVGNQLFWDPRMPTSSPEIVP